MEGKKEERKILWISGRKYQLLKPKENGNGWHEYGKRKSLKAIKDLFRSGRYAMTMEEPTFYEIRTYEKEQGRRIEKYFSEKALESKTI